MRKVKELRLLYKRRRVLMSVMSVMACCALFGTSYLLIQPAVTMTSDTHCGLVEHVHAEACYEQELVCTEEHEHTDACCESVLVCTETEHAHTLACYSDPTAIETEEDIAAYLKGMKVTDAWGTDSAAVASAMVGYAERTDNYTVCEDGTTTKGYTFFGDCAGTPYADWNVLFADFCLDMAEVPEGDFPREAEAAVWADALETEGYLSTELSDACVGDLVFTDTDADGAADRVGILTAIEDDTLNVVEGDSGNAVAELTYSAGDIVSFGMVTACQACKDTVAQISALTDEGFLLDGLDGANSESSETTGGAVLEKQIKANEDGSYTLRLSAYVTGETVVVQNYTPVDVVVIVDTSGSMAYTDAKNKAGTSGQARMSVLQESLSALVSSLVSHSSADDPSRVSIIEFNYWRDLTWPDGSGNNYPGTTQALLSQLTSVLSADSTDTNRVVNSTVTGVVNSLTPHDGTATEPWKAFELANSILYPANDAHSEHQKIVVFFTDGEPSPRVDGFGYDSSNTYDSYKNHDQFTRYQNMNRTVEKAKILKDKGATIFSIGVFGSNMDVSNTGIVFRFLDAVSSDNRPSGSNKSVGSLLTLKDSSTTISGYGTTNGTASLGYPEFQSTTAPTGTTNDTRSDISSSSYKWTAPSETPYCVASKNADGITTGFETVTDEILTLSANLDEETILRDVLTLDFITEGDDTAEIVDIYGLSCTGFNTNGTPIWSTTKDTTYTQQCVCTIDREYSTVDTDGKSIVTQAIDVKGFNYSEHWVGKKGDGTNHAEGQKLVVEIKIHATKETASALAQDSNLPDSGIYDDGKKVSEFVVPDVELPTVMDIQVTGDPGYCDVELSKTATFHPPYDTSETAFTEHLKIDWSVTDQYKEQVGEGKTAYYLGEKKALEVLTKDSTTEQRLYAPFPEPVSVTVSIPEGYTATYTLDGEPIVGTPTQDGRLLFELDDGTRKEGENGNYHLFKVVLTKKVVSLSFTKKNEDSNEAISGRTFTLTKAGASEASYTVTSDSKGIVSFGSIEWDHKRYDASGKEDPNGSTGTTVYLLKETNLPSNYAPKYDYKLYIKDGALTIKTFDGDTEITSGEGIVWTAAGANIFYNKPIIVKLTVKNSILPDGRNNSFAFTVSYVDAVTNQTVTRQTTAFLNGTPETSLTKEFSKLFENIPYGSVVTVTESGYDGYSLAIEKDGTSVGNDNPYTFTITKDTTLTFINITGYTLPSTGGCGSELLYILGGLLSMTALAGFVLWRKREGRAE